MSPLRSKEVLQLGVRLVAQLDRKDDLLASWMSHYIAELIEKAETASTEHKIAAQEAAAKAILELWQHRSALPERVRPFAKLEPVLRTLASLDEEHASKRYYARDRDDAEANADEEMLKWLEFSRDVDNAARFLIGTAISSAVEGSAASMAPWVALAERAELNDNIEHSVLTFARKAVESGDEGLMRQATMRLRLARIESFLKAGVALANELRTYVAKGDVDRAQTVDDDEETNTAGLRAADEDEDEGEGQDEDQ